MKHEKTHDPGPGKKETPTKPGAPETPKREPVPGTPQTTPEERPSDPNKQPGPVREHPADPNPSDPIGEKNDLGPERITNVPRERFF
ncbi:MAG: hypothetical protein R2815_10775 [Flavobacteriales bacterium]|nr:hypothetical protein [Flavobacteriales bacterium]